MHTDAYYEADIAIVGGGIAGCTLAMALAPSYSVLLIDKLPEPLERVGECLAPAARRVLRKLDLLDPMVQQPAAGLYLPGLGARSCWGSATVHIVDHLHNPDGPAWHLNRKEFESYLRKEAVSRGVQCLWGMQLRNSHFGNARWRLKVGAATEPVEGHGIAITAKFVVDASGRLAGFARQQAVNRRHYDKLVAHWALVPSRETVRMSMISAAETGWWYSAPVPGAKRVLALHTDPDLVDRQSVKDPAWFIHAAQTNREMAEILAGATGPIDYCGVVAANSTRLKQVAGKQWAAVGDAAMSFDPLSSQGMFNAMAGALQLADLLLAPDRDKLDDPQLMEQVNSVYTAQMDQIWKHYVQHKNTFYTQEQRWKDALFWKRRTTDKPLS